MFKKIMTLIALMTTSTIAIANIEKEIKDTQKMTNISFVDLKIGENKEINLKCNKESECKIKENFSEMKILTNNEYLDFICVYNDLSKECVSYGFGSIYFIEKLIDTNTTNHAKLIKEIEKKLENLGFKKDDKIEPLSKHKGYEFYKSENDRLYGIKTDKYTISTVFTNVEAINKYKESEKKEREIKIQNIINDSLKYLE
jgi:hypothetical protein